jgi:hypothetical protein
MTRRAAGPMPSPVKPVAGLRPRAANRPRWNRETLRKLESWSVEA